jgi:hypothetical protein
MSTMSAKRSDRVAKPQEEHTTMKKTRTRRRKGQTYSLRKAIVSPLEAIEDGDYFLPPSKTCFAPASSFSFSLLTFG